MKSATLARVRAKEFLTVAGQGQSLPFVARCEGDSGTEVLLVKSPGARSSLGARELVVELGGTLLCRRLGLLVARPFAVEIGDDFSRRAFERAGLPLDEGWAVGFRFIEGLLPFVAREDSRLLPSENRVALLLADLLLANGDRASLNPNLAWSAGRLFVFDFDHCLELPRTPERAIAAHRETLSNLYQSHLLHRRMRGHEARSLTRRIERGEWPDPPPRIAGLPTEWKHEWLRYVEYSDRLRGERKLFAEAAIEAMAS